MIAQVINKHIESCGFKRAVSVDRGTDWGNPFVMHSEAERHYVCDMFDKYAKWRLTVEPHWLNPLKGRWLACWCTPRRCHAETLWRLANVAMEQD